MNFNELDNPVWNSLSQTHKDFSLTYENLKFYNPKFCPFGSYLLPENVGVGIDKYSKLADSFFIVGNEPILGNKKMLIKKFPCEQMVLSKKIEIEPKEEITLLKTERHKLDLLELVTLVQPGYFVKDTAELGTYFGIYKNNKLVAVTGERLKMNGFTEISAVVTHPKHTGNGYAKQLISKTIDYIIKDDKTPYLHVLDTNIGPIKLYQKLGFEIRRKINFWNLKKV